MINVKECFEKGLLKKSVPDKNLAEKSIKQAEFFLNETKDLLDINKKTIAIISLYNAYFHIARSLLFKDGIKERSHYCVARYLEENYIGKKIDKKFLNSFETVMSLRHNVQYSTEQIEIDEDINELVNICDDFIEEIKKCTTK